MRPHPTGPVRRTLAAVAAATLLALPLGGCATAATATTSSATATTAGVASTPIEGVSSGSATVTFDGKEVTLSAAYLVDGTEVSVDAGSYASATADQAVFLVVNGARSPSLGRP